jgi:hypothetical protein
MVAIHAPSDEIIPCHLAGRQALSGAKGQIGARVGVALSSSLRCARTYICTYIWEGCCLMLGDLSGIAGAKFKPVRARHDRLG